MFLSVVDQHGHGTLLEWSLLVFCLQDYSESHVTQLWAFWGDDYDQIDLDEDLVEIETLKEIVWGLYFQKAVQGVVQVDL